MTSSTRRVAATTALAAAALGAGVSATSAQAPPAPAELRVDVVAGKAPTLGSTDIRPGLTQIVAVTRGRAGDVGIVRLKEGKTLADLRKAVDKANIGPEQIDRVARDLGDLLMGGTAQKGRAYRTTIDLTAGNYALLNTGIEKRTPMRGFTVAGEPTGAVGAEPAATVDMRDYRFVPSSSTLPAGELVRVTNSGKRLHFMLAFPTRNADRLVSRLKANDEKGAERYMAGAPSEPVGLVSPGTTNDVPLRLKKGTYVLVCFYGSRASRNKSHNALGMARKVRVR